MQHHFPRRSHPRRGGFVTLGTLILAAVAAAAIVAMSGCHAAPPPPSGFVSSSADKVTEARLRRGVEPFKPLQPFDEGFVVVDDAASN